MRMIRKLVVLGLAGLGLYKAWELASAKLIDVRQRADDAKARLEPALHDTADTIQAAADDVEASIRDLSHAVADTVTAPASNSSADPQSARSPMQSTPEFR
jgi:hypothetical protein